MIKKSQLFLLLFTVTKLCSAMNEESTITVINNTTESFTCSVRTGASHNATNIASYIKGSQQQLKSGYVVQSLIITPDRSLSVPEHIAIQVEKHCKRKYYVVERNSKNSTMTIYKNNN